MSSLAGSKETMSGGRKVQARTGQAAPNQRRPSYHMLQRSLGNARLAHMLQARLTVSDPGDIFEQEAERVADEVLRMPEPSLGSARRAAPQIQRLCPECQEDVNRQPLEEEELVQAKPLAPGALVQRQEPEEEEEPVRAKANPEGRHAVSPEVEGAIEALPGRGHPLPESVRSFMEPRFNADFRAVRIHTDAHAQGLARAVSAQAFTVGRDVVFGAGDYAPETERGRHLLAHELTHVVQQVPTVRAKTKRAQKTHWDLSAVRHSLGTTPGSAHRIQRACQHFPAYASPDTYCQTRPEAEAQVVNACPPNRNCFVYRDGPATHPWRRIPGHGCAHWVAHEMGITQGPSYANCRAGNSVTIGQILTGRAAHPLSNAQVGDIWSDGGHSGIVRRVDAGPPLGPRVRIEQCGVGGNVSTYWENTGQAYR